MCKYYEYLLTEEMQYDIQNCNVFMTLEREIYIYITTGTPFYEGRHIVSPCFYRR